MTAKGIAVDTELLGMLVSHAPEDGMPIYDYRSMGDLAGKIGFSNGSRQLNRRLGRLNQPTSRDVRYVRYASRRLKECTPAATNPSVHTLVVLPEGYVLGQIKRRDGAWCVLKGSLPNDVQKATDYLIKLRVIKCTVVMGSHGKVYVTYRFA